MTDKQKPTVIFIAALLLSLLSFVSNAQERYIGEIFLVGFNFCPRGSIAADGQLLSVVDNDALFSLYGTTFGGDGRTTFGLPDLRGRVPMHAGAGPGLNSYRHGQSGGQEEVVLTEAQLPSHSHDAKTTIDVNASLNTVEDVPNSSSATDAALAEAQIYNNAESPSSSLKESAIVVEAVATTSVSNAGSGQAVSIMQPFLAMRYCIVTEGLYPSRN